MDADEEPTPAYARGGLVVGPGGEDSVEVRLFEREAIVDRDGRVICRHVGGRLIPAGTDYSEAVASLIADRLPEEGEPVIFDAADATWTDGPLQNAKMIVGDFTLRIGEDGTELLVDDDAVVLDLDPAVEEVSGEGYARRPIDWTAVSGGPFVWSAAPVAEDCGGDCDCCDADCRQCCCCLKTCPPESYCLACGRRI